MTPDKKAVTLTIDTDDAVADRAFRATRELMDRIVEAENVALMNEINANAVVINGRKYGMIKHHPGLIPTIFGMRAETRADMPGDWDFFLQERPPLILTNYDRLVSKTPEELAGYLYKHDFCKTPFSSDKQNWCDGDCEKCLAEWLKSPVRWIGR